MNYATLMVHLQPGPSNATVLDLTCQLASRYNARVVGIVAVQPMQLDYGDGLVSGDVYELNRKEIQQEVKNAEEEFRRLLAPTVERLEWRSVSTFSPLVDYIASEARCADLILTSVDASSYFDNVRRIDTGDLVMQAGRPVLLVPTTADRPKLERVLIGWKDTRETRRAIVDALPLLRDAVHVSLVEICAEDQRAASRARLADVASWLQRHGVEARCLSSPPAGDDATALYALSQDMAIDLTVAGAYGHSRLREWALGGVTRDLLVSANRCSLVSR